MHGGVCFVLLHSAAYGRYLDNFDPHPDAVMWRAIRTWDDDDVLLCHNDAIHRNLRTNSRRRPWQRTSVTVDRLFAKRSTMMRWRVAPPPPPPPTQPKGGTVRPSTSGYIISGELTVAPLIGIYSSH
ncbi:hypothetical protein HU200_056736 [Digitaria exilis]|uniref:Uncharacterized protein n=1 Tax=Digitaria exilis TaxID=1010633 RepID=A0A835ACB4_9POAL|nr:hypothetical protein HU200_056736 [Digitaria exilis]